MNIFPKRQSLLPNMKNLFEDKPSSEVRHALPKQDINLLPESVLEQRRFDRAFRLACLGFVAFLTVAVTVLMIPFGTALTLEIEKSQLISKIAETSAVEQLEKKVFESRKTLADRQAFIAWLNRSDTVIAAVFASMEKVIPKTLFLTEISQQTVETKNAATPSKRVISIRGEATDKDSVAAFQNSLEQTGFYESVFIMSMGERDEKNEDTDTVVRFDDFGRIYEETVVISSDEKTIVSFEIECVLKEWGIGVEKSKPRQ